MLTRARVDFRRPRKEVKTNSNYTFVDMHFHTKYSDGTRKIPSVAKKAKKLGVGVAVTDHNEIRGAIEISKYKDILSIPSIETTSKEGIHTLYYFYSPEELAEFYNHNILPNKKKTTYFLDIPFHELFDISRDYNCIITAAHPYGAGWTGVCNQVHKDVVSKKVIKHFDALEVINGASLKHMNQNAVDLAESLKKGITGGSDGHRLFELGKVLTYVKNPASREDFLKGIIKKTNFIIGKETNVVQKVAANSSRITQPVKNPVGTMNRGYHYLKQKI